MAGSKAGCSPPGRGALQWVRAAFFGRHLARTNETVSQLVPRLPSVCAALASICRKWESVKHPGQEDAGPAQALSARRQALGYRMVTPYPFTSKVMASEQRVLETLCWKIDVPTLPTWISAYWARLQAFLARAPHVQPPLEWRWLDVNIVVPWLVYHAPTTAPMPPRSVARAALGLRALAAGLLEWSAKAAVKLALGAHVFLHMATQPPWMPDELQSERPRRLMRKAFLTAADCTEVELMQECVRLEMTSAITAREARHHLAAASRSGSARGTTYCSV